MSQTNGLFESIAPWSVFHIVAMLAGSESACSKDIAVPQQAVEVWYGQDEGVNSTH